MRRRQSFVEGAAVLIAANLAVKVIGAVFRIPLDGLLGKAGMGLFNVAYVLYTTMLVLSTAGLPVAVSKLVAEAVSLGRSRETGRIVCVAGSVFLAFGAVCAAALFLGADVLAERVGSPEAAPAVRAIAPAVFCAAPISVVRGYFQGLSDMTPTAVSQLVEALGKLALGYGLAFYAGMHGLPLPVRAAAAVAGVTIGEVLATLYLAGCLALRRPVSPRLHDHVRPRRELLGALLRVAVPITLGASVMSLTGLLDVALVMNRLQDSGIPAARATALYGAYSNRAMTLFNLPQTVIIGLSISMLPVLSGAQARQNFTQVSRTIGAAVRLTLLLALPAGVGYLVLGEPIVTLLFGPDTISAGAFLRVLGLAVPLVAMVSLTNALPQALGHPMAPVKSMLLGALAKLAGNYVLIGLPRIGIFGAPVSTVLCYALILAGNLCAVRRLTAAMPKAREAVLPPLAAACGMGAFASVLFPVLEGLLGANPAVLMTTGLSAVVYLLFLRLLGALHREDVLLMPHGGTLCRLLRLS